MISKKKVIKISEDIRGLFEADPENSPARIERLLLARFEHYSHREAREALQQLIENFRLRRCHKSPADNEIMAKVFRLILGDKVASDDLTSAELLERLAQSLNTIFDALNKLIGVIDMSFSSNGGSNDQTIRQVIGFHLESDDQTQPIEEYLGQINQAFLNTHKAFKKAAHRQVERILQSLDMEQVAKDRSYGVKFGPFRKAEDYQILIEKIESIREWFESGRCSVDFLREFEKNCQVLAQK